MRRGRPGRSQGRNVPEAILRASEACLAEKSHVDLTLRDVAQRAGTSQEMIQYYFGGRDGLLAALSARVSDAIAAGLGAIDPAGFDDGLAFTMAIVRALAVPTCDSPNVAAIIIWETIRTASSVRARYVQDGKSRTGAAMCRLVEAGAARGFYPADVDPRLATLSFMSLVIGLPMLPSISQGIALEAWIAHAGRLLHAGLNAA